MRFVSCVTSVASSVFVIYFTNWDVLYIRKVYLTNAEVKIDYGHAL